LIGSISFFVALFVRPAFYIQDRGLFFEENIFFWAPKNLDAASLVAERCRLDGSWGWARPLLPAKIVRIGPAVCPEMGAEVLASVHPRRKMGTSFGGVRRVRPGSDRDAVLRICPQLDRARFVYSEISLRGNVYEKYVPQAEKNGEKSKKVDFLFFGVEGQPVDRKL
jgi:hypothetical protein